MIKRIWILFLPFLFFACEDEVAVLTDGKGNLEINVFYSSNDGEKLPLDSASVILTSEYGEFSYLTNVQGKLNLNGLPYTKYNVSIQKAHPLDKNILLNANEKEIELKPFETVKKEFLTMPVSGNGLVINEIYTCGPENNIFYFYDQFIELYNSSNETKYLDGMCVYRVSSNRSKDDIIRKGPGADEDDDGDIDGVTYVFKFPGKPGEQNYPIEPKAFAVLASDAVNHKNNLKVAVDLSGAQWEFYNQYSPSDIDNPNVPNLLNVRSDKTPDFLISLMSDVIIISDGTDMEWTDGIDISSILDGVEYQPSTNWYITLDDRIDRGIVLSPARYSGKSMQRKIPGMDSNDGTLDWEILDTPTPGYHK